MRQLRFGDDDDWDESLNIEACIWVYALSWYAVKMNMHCQARFVALWWAHTKHNIGYYTLLYREPILPRQYATFPCQTAFSIYTNKTHTSHSIILPNSIQSTIINDTMVCVWCACVWRWIKRFMELKFCNIISNWDTLALAVAARNFNSNSFWTFMCVRVVYRFRLCISFSIVQLSYKRALCAVHSSVLSFW